MIGCSYQKGRALQVFKSHKVIEFRSVFPGEPAAPPPVTSVSGNIPGWYKKIPKYAFGGTKFTIEDGQTNQTLRACMPFLETFTAGYVFSLGTDIQVRILDNGIHRITWLGQNHSMAPVVERDFRDRSYTESTFPTIEGYEPLQFNWLPYWAVKTPPGYSCYFIHPLNRIDLPFYTLGGVLDTDKWGEPGNHPFLLKKGWEGIIEAGTPLVQVIPFKRDSWNSQLKEGSYEEHRKKLVERDRWAKNWYKRNAWSSKSYR